MTHCPPPAGQLRFRTRTRLLAKLETDEASGLIITGRAGVGKTRLMLELGHRALSAWLASYEDASRPH
jgi:DNA replication protein DnaC